MCHNCINEDHRYCPMCERQIPPREYSKHMGDCYDFYKTATPLKHAQEGEFIEFYRFRNQVERPCIVYADFECSLINSDDM